MIHRTLVALVSAVWIVACASADTAFDIRDAERPAYSNTLGVEDVDAFLAGGGVLVDVRLAEDFAQDPRLIPGAIRVDPEDPSFWQSADPNKPIAVYCVKGKWVSQKTATYVSSIGFETYSLAGGLMAYDALARDESAAAD